MIQKAGAFGNGSDPTTGKIMRICKQVDNNGDGTDDGVTFKFVSSEFGVFNYYLDPGGIFNRTVKESDGLVCDLRAAVHNGETEFHVKEAPIIPGWPGHAPGYPKWEVLGPAPANTVLQSGLAVQLPSQYNQYLGAQINTTMLTGDSTFVMHNKAGTRKLTMCVNVMDNGIAPIDSAAFQLGLLGVDSQETAITAEGSTNCVTFGAPSSNTFGLLLGNAPLPWPGFAYGFPTYSYTTGGGGSGNGVGIESGGSYYVPFDFAALANAGDITFNFTVKPGRRLTVCKQLLNNGDGIDNSGTFGLSQGTNIGTDNVNLTVTEGGAVVCGATGRVGNYGGPVQAIIQELSLPTNWPGNTPGFPLFKWTTTGGQSGTGSGNNVTFDLTNTPDVSGIENTTGDITVTFFNRTGPPRLLTLCKEVEDNADILANQGGVFTLTGGGDVGTPATYQLTQTEGQPRVCSPPITLDPLATTISAMETAPGNWPGNAAGFPKWTLLDGANGTVASGTGTPTSNLLLSNFIGNPTIVFRNRAIPTVICTYTLFPINLPKARVGGHYSEQLSTRGNTSPVTFSVNPGSSLPSWLTLSSSGLLSSTPSGVPSLPGSASFTIKVTDSNGCMVLRPYTLNWIFSHDGIQYSTLGQATVTTAPNGSLLVNNFGTSHNDGVAFDLGAPLISQGAGLSIQPDDTLDIPNVGGEIKLSLNGQFNGVDKTLGTVTFKKFPDFFTASTDFSPIGVSSYVVEVYSGTTLVKTFSGHSGQNISYKPCAASLAPTTKGTAIPGVDVVLKKKPGGDASGNTRFGACVQLDFGAGFGVSQGDSMVLTGTPAVTFAAGDALTGASIKGASYGQFALSSIGVTALNQPFQVLGNALIGASGNTVTLSNNGSSSQDGASIVIEQPGIKRFSASIAPFDESTIPAGAYLQAEAQCCPLSPQVLSTMRETKTASGGYSVTHDFGSLTPTTQGVTIYNNNVPVLVVDGFNGPVDASSGWKTYSQGKSNTAAFSSVNAAQAAHPQLSGQTFNTLSLAALYPANTVFTINGTNYVGDQLEFRAVGGTGTAIGDFSALNLTAADIPEFTITDVQSVPADNPPTIAAAGVTRQAGSPSASATVANVNDTEDAKNTLVVKVNNGTTATVNGVTVSGISVDSAGVVTANVVAVCGATNASFALTVFDSGGSAVSASLDVSVNPNDPPMLSYNAQTVAAGGALTVNPTAPPSDNGSIASIAVQSLGTFTGTLSVNNTTGGVSISNAKPIGTHTITIRATDNCGATKDASFTLGIGCPTINITPASLPNGFVGTNYNQTLTASGGAGAYTFAVTTGNLPSGITLTGATLSGTPTTQGTFSFSITATDATNCSVSQAYTVVISGNGLVFYPLPRPVRILDTRPGGNCDNVSTPVNGGSSITVLARLTCEGITIPDTAKAIVGNVTVLNQTNLIGYMTVYPDGQQAPVAANMIYAPNDILANNFTVGLSTDGKFDIFGERTIHAVVDVSGYYAPPASGGLYYHPLPKPVRLLDTRANQGNCDNVATPISAGTSITTLARTTCEGVTIPSAAQAIVGNATVINGSGQLGYLTIYPNGVAAPLAANLIYFPGQILSNAFTVSLDASGQFNIFGEKTIDIVVDVAGYYSSEATDANGAGLLLTPLSRPLRILDTRANQGNCDNVATPITGGSSIAASGRLTCESVTIPTAAQAILGNVTVINQTSSAGYLTLWPDGVSQPLAANMIYFPSQILSNAFVVGLNSGTGNYRLFAERTLEAIVDASAYFAP